MIDTINDARPDTTLSITSASPSPFCVGYKVNVAPRRITIFALRSIGTPPLPEYAIRTETLFLELCGEISPPLIKQDRTKRLKL
jgi:hypothetical protein